MALIYNADLVPSKLDLLSAWAGSQPWAAGADTGELVAVGAYRFDDPAGEVGIETHLVTARDGGLLHIPLTYRAGALPGAEAALIGTLEHSVLGRRWIYDGCADPVYASALATAILTGGEEAELEYASNGERRRSTTRVSGTGDATEPVTLDAACPVVDGASTVITCSQGLRLIVRHRLAAPGPSGSGPQLTGIWPGHDSPEVLAVAEIRPGG